MFRLFFVCNFLLAFVLSAEGLKCGRTNRIRPGTEVKIVGGYEVGFFKYPWFGALTIKNDVLCGSALIAPNVFLTAAHCFSYFMGLTRLEDVFIMKIGVYDNCINEDTQRELKTTNVIIHEKYKKGKPYNDIALVITEENNYFEPICLPSKVFTDEDLQGEAFIAGFGILKEGSQDFPCQMYEGRVLLYSSKVCKRMVEFLSDDDEILSEFTNAICAGYRTGKVDTCQGDSGGPMMIEDPDTGKYTILGITSFGFGCGQRNQMGIYTDVSKYLDWIHSKSGVDSTEEKEENFITINDNNLNIFSNIIDEVLNKSHGLKRIIIEFGNNSD